jgi:hypothetical protein
VPAPGTGAGRAGGSPPWASASTRAAGPCLLARTRASSAPSTPNDRCYADADRANIQKSGFARVPPSWGTSFKCMTQWFGSRERGLSRGVIP